MRSFDFLAPLYDLFERPPERSGLLSLLGADGGGLLLDVGGGTGRVTHQLRDRFARVVVCDVSLGMLRRAAGRQGLIPIAACSERLPFRTGIADAVVITDALHHFQDRDRALDEVVRVLRPGGRVLIEEPDIRRPLGRFTAWAERCVGFRGRFLSPWDVCRCLEERGIVARVMEEGGFRARILGEKPDDGGQKHSASD
ncbi:MAG: class I SAM-dependent methyltransferase [Kiritimatiellaeota bacterium]|nr:class I SAM-dependent methyltransferase [Kiritimatiellota bacterium]